MARGGGDRAKPNKAVPKPPPPRRRSRQAAGDARARVRGSQATSTATPVRGGGAGPCDGVGSNAQNERTPQPQPPTPAPAPASRKAQKQQRAPAPHLEETPQFGHVDLENVLDARGRDEWDIMQQLMVPPPKVAKKIVMDTPPRTPNRIVPRFPPLGGPKLTPRAPPTLADKMRKPAFFRNASSIEFAQDDVGGHIEKHLVKHDPQGTKWTEQEWRDATPVRRTIRKRPLPTDASIVVMA